MEGDAIEPTGDQFAQLAAERFADGDVDEAIRLQTTALEHPCTRRRFEQGTLLGYRFVGREDHAALDDLRGSRTSGAADALLLAGFAVQVETLELGLALRLHDDALDVAKAATPADDVLLREIRTFRAAAREAAGFDPDADDLELLL